MAFGCLVQAILKADMVRIVARSMEERLTALIVMSESQDHNLRGLTDRMDYADPRTDYDMHRMSYSSIILGITEQILRGSV